MIRYVEPAQRDSERAALKQYFQLRKRVFCDRLKWVEPGEDGCEQDAFDKCYNIYILDIDETSNRVNGGVRLMPTTGPTLLHTVWADLLPDQGEFRSPTIWEATRFCVDENIDSRRGNLVNRSTLSVALAVMDFAAANGITHLIAVCEASFFDMIAAFGEQPEILSRRVDNNGREIGCGLWSTRPDTPLLAWARPLMGDVQPILLDKKSSVSGNGLSAGGDPVKRVAPINHSDRRTVCAGIE